MTKIISEESQQLVERLEANPMLMSRVKALLDLSENKNSVRLADEAELEVTQQLRGMGHELLSDWSIARAQELDAQSSRPGVSRHEKKKFAGKVPTEK
jgi:hypothetical protein